MRSELWRSARWPLLVLGIAGLALGIATALDRTPAREWALTLGAPALLVLPIGLVWLIVVIVAHVLQRRRDDRRPGGGR
jgi:hypothetical protein